MSALTPWLVSTRSFNSDFDHEDDWKRLTLQIPLANGPAVQALQANADILKRITREAEIALGGISWTPENAKNERAFCEVVVAPLLLQMRFL